MKTSYRGFRINEYRSYDPYVGVKVPREDAWMYVNLRLAADTVRSNVAANYDTINTYDDIKRGSDISVTLEYNQLANDFHDQVVLKALGEDYSNPQEFDLPGHEMLAEDIDRIAGSMTPRLASMYARRHSAGQLDQFAVRDDHMFHRYFLALMRHYTRRFCEDIPEELSKDVIRVHRQVMVEPEWVNRLADGRQRRLGRYWSYSDDTMAYWVSKQGAFEVMLEADVHHTNVNWVVTAVCNSNRVGIPQEREVRLLNRTPIHLRRAYTYDVGIAHLEEVSDEAITIRKRVVDVNIGKDYTA